MITPYGLFLTQEDVHDFAGSLGYGSTGAEDGGDASLVEEVVVLSGDDTAGDDHDILATQLLEREIS